MKILFISDNFPPEVNAPASRTYEHAKRWVASGNEVTVITCAPNFPQGRVHDGYRNAWRTVEFLDGIRVVRVKTYITGNEGFARRIIDYLSFMVSAVFFGLFERRPDVIVGTSPQFFAALGAWKLSTLKWTPFVLELRDLWPASIVTVGAMKRGFIVNVLEKMEKFLYRRAAAIVSVTASFEDDLVQRGIDGRKIHVIRNGVDLDRFRPQERSRAMAERLGVAGKFVVSYLGTHGMAHALENLVETAALLRDDNSIMFLLVGDGAAKRDVVRVVQARGIDNVVFHDPVAKDAMPDVWSVSDLCLVHLKNDPVFSTVIPSKIFEAFGMGRPILIVQPPGEAVDLVVEAGAGLWVPPEDPEALAGVIRELKQDPVRCQSMADASAATAKHHSRERLAQDMLEVLNCAARPAS